MFLKDTNNFTVTKATTLTTARTINGTSFNGSANITTANWGTARTITIGSTGKSVNGSGNVSWTLSEIGAAAASHTHSYLPLSGGTLTGRLTANGKVSAPTTGGSWITGMTLTNATIAVTTQQTTSSYHPVLAVKTSGNHVANIGGLGDNFGFYGFKSGRTENATDWSFVFNASSGAVTSTAAITAPTFNGALNGNATTATTATKANALTTARTINGTSFNGSANITTANWGTARNLTIGNTAKSVNGSANISWSLSEIGAAPASHTHSYAPISHEQDYAGTNSNTYIAYPKDGRYRGSSNNASVTGYLKITLPQTWTSSMMKFDVDVFNYVDNETMTYTISGYNYSNGASSAWHSVTAACKTHQNNPKRNLSVRFGHDGTKCAIYIGEASTVWTYPQVTVKNITVGYSNYALTSWNTGWVVGYTTTLGTINKTVTNPYVGNGGMASTANTLATARTINGTSFNGSANITTANWGTARNITIGKTAKSVNGSGNVSWSLSEIGAFSSGGGDVGGNIHLTPDNAGITGVCGGGTDRWSIIGGGADDNGYLEINTKDNGNEPIYVRQYNANGLVRTASILDGQGNSAFPGIVRAPRFAISGSQGGDNNTIYAGSGDAADWSKHNLVIRSHWGIGFHDYSDACKIVFDTRNGNMNTRGVVYSEGGFSTTQGLAVNGHSTLSGGVTINGGTLSGEIKFSGQSGYSDPWNGMGCAIKAAGHIAATGIIRANQYLQVGGTPLSIQSSAPGCGGVWIQI